jgi:hypothetical protein
MLRDTLWECSKTIISRRNDEKSAFPDRGIVLKSRFLAPLEMTFYAVGRLFEHSRFSSRSSQPANLSPPFVFQTDKKPLDI